MTDREKAENIAKCADRFREGCTNAGPMVAKLGLSSDPFDCEECVEGFLKAVKNNLEGIDNV